ncbi:MAG: transketolase family protein [Candidatus Fermentithermobacillus carboniphilus]|uniref:Transketolase family protein n=1 Tax=Candidatus Fermentithermobacillus carboniphilus TaxID=3085328 RepID=A0AAT9LA87_9FIRM|nr:MAG: transketolase family protein [Candidatus Fermentithermobacillus carboniphilus]
MVAMIATRDAYGEILVELGRENPNIVVLDADLSSSTKTEKFAKAFPERFFNVGIAEANMMGIAAGLARSGKIPFVSTFAVFATGRAYDQIRQSIAYPRFNVKIVASHGGLSVGPDGASHQALEDVALMRAIPGMVVIVPCDAHETKEAIKAALRHDGPVYVRLGREKVPSVLPDDATFEIGKGLILWPDKRREDLISSVSRGEPKESAHLFDVAFVASGIMVKPALDAARILGQEGKTCLVADFASIKPLDEELLVAIAKNSRLVVTCEEHSIIGGLGSAVCETLAENYPRPVLRVGVRDEFGQSGSAQELLDAYGLTAEGIVETARKGLSKV